MIEIPTTTSLKIAVADPPQVSEVTYIAVTWLSVSMALISVIVRAVIQIRFGTGRFKLDDYLIGFAMVLLLTMAIIYTLTADEMYFVFNTAGGKLPVPDTVDGINTLMGKTRSFLRHDYATMWVFWACLWSVKAAFLAFFYPLSNGLKWDRRAWYTVAVFCVLGYITCNIQFQFVCGDPQSFLAAKCLSKLDVQRQQASLKVSSALDISTDIAIMVLPWKLVIVVKKSLKEKLSIGCIIGLGIIVVIFSIIRVCLVNANGTFPAPVWVQLWSMVEASVALIVISATALRVLIVKSHAKTTNGYNGYYSYSKEMSSGSDMRSGILIDKGVSVEWSQRSVSEDSPPIVPPKNSYMPNHRNVDRPSEIMEIA